jgi:hypothetical protein
LRKRPGATSTGGGDPGTLEFTSNTVEIPLDDSYTNAILQGLLEEYADDYNAREQDRHMQAADKALRDGLRRSSAPAAEEGPNWWQIGVETVAGILLKPIDLMLTARDVYKEPGNPINYLGVFLPSGLRKAAKALAGQADKLDEAIDTVKAARAADQAEEAAKFAKPQAADAAPLHHLATDKNRVSTLRGGPWTPRFEALFKKAGLTLDDAANKVNIPGHSGPHPEAYHREVYDRLVRATRGLGGEPYKKALLNELMAIRDEALTPGSRLNDLITNQ